MSDPTANKMQTPQSDFSFSALFAGLEPMGDLTGFAIDDLSEAEEDEFFSILDDV